MQAFLLTYLDASTLSRYVFSLALAVSLESLETTSDTAAVIDPLTIIQDLNFDRQLFKI